MRDQHRDLHPEDRPLGRALHTSPSSSALVAVLVLVVLLLLLVMVVDLVPATASQTGHQQPHVVEPQPTAPRLVGALFEHLEEVGDELCWHPAPRICHLHLEHRHLIGCALLEVCGDGHCAGGRLCGTGKPSLEPMRHDQQW